MGRVAKYKKVKKFDLYNEKSDNTGRAPKRKDSNKLPNSFRLMKYQKDQMLKREEAARKAKQQAGSKKEIQKKQKPEQDNNKNEDDQSNTKLVQV